ncbi:MAG: o-succinylbenzoate---CoA ligase, partial [Thermoleophilaceae bacterium]|nr:o-succinylbenzoate---CoA ligase [Thermoleophilaceae bacterium]
AVHTVIFTSGSTATPRPIELTNANHAASAAASAWNLGVDPDDRWLCVLPLFHVGGLSILLRSVIYGTTAVIHDSFDARAVAAALATGRISLASLVPTMLRRLREAGLTDAPGLRAILLGGGPIPADLLEWAREAGLPVAPTYGMTETASQVATADPVQALEGIRGARALQGADIRIADDGEILVRGEMVSRGALADDGWLHTGDLGRIDDGLLQVTGRLKDVIVSGGENVSPAEVEEALLHHPCVLDAGVSGVADPEWGEAVSAFVVARDVTAAELIEHCRDLLAPFKVPKHVEFVDSLPRNAAGKLIRARLG